MHWYDSVAILCALVLAAWADYDAGMAIRASVMLYFATVEKDRWVHSYDLRQLFGMSVYKHLRWLRDAGIIERREEPGGPKRGHRSDFFYRRKEIKP
jgi:predicted transcriptional regulator